MDKYKLFAQRIGLVGVTNLLLGLSGIILLPILTKNLPVEDYGIWAQINVTIGIVPAVAAFGLPYTMVRFLPSLSNKEEIQDIFYTIFFLVLLTSAIVSTLIYMLSESIASTLFENNVIIVKILALTVFIECLNYIFIGYFRANQQIKRYSKLMFIQTSLLILLVSFFVLSGKGIIGATLGLLIKSGVLFLIMAFVITSEIGIVTPKFKRVNEYLNFGLPTVPGNISSWVVNSSDRYVIGIFLGTAAVGYYSPGYSLGGIVGMFFAPLAFILPAILSKSYDENNMEEVRNILKYSLKYFLTIAIPAAFGLSILSESILLVLSTPEIASEGYMITPFIAFSTLLLGAYGVISQVIILEKKTKITGKIWILAAILNLGLNFVFIPYIGIIGAAITTLVSFLIGFVFASYYSFKMFKFSTNPGFILKSIFSSLLMCSVIIKLNPLGLLEIIFSIVTGAIIYFVALLLLKSFDIKEIYFFRSILK
jgi:O-antigen/teichoic acid export membrane protein